MNSTPIESPLRHLDITEVSRAARAESRRRQSHLPPVSVFRWWARRTESVVGALVESFGLDRPGRLRIADPFAGGGTIALAAAMRGHQVYAQEINPWAADGLALAMTLPPPKKIAAARDRLHDAKAALLRDAYVVDGVVMLRTIRVQTGRCPDCAEVNKLFPLGLVSLTKRVDAGGKDGWITCPTGHLSLGSAERRRKCPECGRFADPHVRRTAGKQIQCWKCRAGISLRDLSDRNWDVVLVETVGDKGPHEIRPPTTTEAELADSPDFHPRLDLGPIPAGDETSRLLRSGFQSWSDLYPRRQAYIIEQLLDAAELVSDGDSVVQRVLETAILGSVEFAGYSSRWDSRYLKPYETIANHRYEETTLSVEPHVWGHGRAGRGTVGGRLRSLEKAAAWNKARLAGRSVSIRSSRRRIPLSADTTIVTGSSERIGVPDSHFDLVLTDPPYHDDVQYGELSWLFRAWQDCTDPLDGDLTVGAAGCTSAEYRRLLTSAFVEIRRTLKPNGHLILSYANRNPDAWVALVGALNDAGFTAVGYTFATSENESDHAKRGRRAATVDVLLDLTPSRTSVDKFKPATKAFSDQDAFIEVVGAWLLRIGDLSANWETLMRAELSEAPFIQPALA